MGVFLFLMLVAVILNKDSALIVLRIYLKSVGNYGSILYIIYFGAKVEA